MKPSRGFCILVLGVFTVLKATSATVVKQFIVNADFCNKSDTSNPVYINELEMYEIHWYGNLLPDQCDAVFRGSDYKGKTEHYQVCVKPSSYNVTDCDFKLTVFDSESAKTTSCGTKMEEYCTGMDQSLNIKFCATNVTDYNHVVLYMEAKIYEPMRPELIGAIVGGILGFVLIVALFVYICCCKLKRNQKQGEVLDDKALEPLEE